MGGGPGLTLHGLPQGRPHLRGVVDPVEPGLARVELSAAGAQVGEGAERSGEEKEKEKEEEEASRVVFADSSVAQ